MLKKIYVVLFCVASITIPYFTAKNILNYQEFKLAKNADLIVLELWHIETFEGGSGNRGAWLENKAIKFKNQNKHINIMIVDLSPEQLVLQLEAGYTPDAVSFGVGAGEYLRDKLYPVKGEQATAFMMNKYCIIGNGDFMTRAGVGGREDLSEILNFGGFTNRGKSIDSVSVGLKGFTNPLAAVGNKLNVSNRDLTSYEAYERFVAGGSTFLLGTGRDYVRCKGREDSGKMNGLTYQWLEDYTDMVQYFGIFNGIDKEHADAASLFLDYLLSDAVQNSLADIGLFSAKSIKTTINAFTSASVIDRIKGESL